MINGAGAPPQTVPAELAKTKADALWKTLVDSEFTPVTRPDLSMAKPWTMFRVAGFRRVLARTLERTEDVMEPGRPKIIHAQGAVARVELETTSDSSFTGVLGPPPAGGAIGFLRMSLAIPPKGKAAVTPGFGLKLMVDGQPSLDLLAMNHTVGQGRDYNLFANTFTHDLRNEHTELRPPQRLLQFFFKRVSSNPRRLTIDHLAAVNREGIGSPQPEVPERLLFRPHPDVTRLFRGCQYDDFRDTLSRIEPGGALYDIEAVDAGATGQNLRIGSLRITSRFISSEGGDRLFFKHPVAQEDRR